MRHLIIALILLAAAPAHAQCHYSVSPGTASFTGLLASEDCEIWDAGHLQTANRPWTVQVMAALEVSDAALDMVVTGILKADIAARELGLSEVRVGGSVTVTLADVPNPSGGLPPHGEADFLGGRCYITILPRAYTGDLTRLAQTVAHEYFHCVVAGTIGASHGFYEPLGPLPGDRAHDWFAEGAPEWFGLFAVAGGDIGYEVDDFELRADHVALNRMGYSGFVFFTWYAETNGADSVMPFLRRLDERHGEPKAVNALLAPEDWLAFARRYASFHVQRRDRSRLFPDRRQPRPPIPITEDTAKSFVSPLATFSRRELEFGPGEWQVTAGEGGPRYLSRALANGDPDGSWEEITGDLVVRTGCERTERRVLLGYGTDEAETPYELEFTRIGDPCDHSCANVPFTRDACLIGRWEDTTFTPVEEASAPGTTIREMDHPPPTYTFFHDGLFRNDSPFYSDIIMRDGSDWLVNQTQFDVSAALGTWGTDAGRLEVCVDAETARGNARFALSDGQSSTTSLNQDKNLLAEGEERELSFSYSCEGNSLVLRSGFLGIVRGEFRRLDPLPEMPDDPAAGPDTVPLIPLPPRRDRR